MDEPETTPLNDEDLERIRRTALRMVGCSGLGGHEEPLTWEQVRHWEAVSAEDGLRLVREVEGLRDQVALTVVHLADQATDEWWDELHRRGHDLAWAHEWLAGRETDDG